ncbi:hypothetical protein SCE1572_36455 [Sorangium cellulosum So0157-2]|uniref:Uncharacterized protein n=1 Tax=Sorangium cellulosum So0157-2 TaxID=1254432 RepID=S4Y3Z8_SORCE|nr:hypothetical protein SCE1572_36455 [Sorangium cellulosum So0157-2]
MRHAGPFDVAGSNGQTKPLPEIAEELGSRRSCRLQRVLVRPIRGGSAPVY